MNLDGWMMKKILIRFDDMCPTMNQYQFYQAIQLLDKYDVHALLGVIPSCMDPELQIDEENKLFWMQMKDLQQKGYTLAMHGNNHVYDSHIRGNVNIGFQSEFAGHTYEKQLKKIRNGKETLKRHGIETDIFFAPSHSYDNATLKALNACGFKYISDGYSLKPIRRFGVICIPCRTTGCPTIKGDGYYTAVFHPHEWTRPDKASGYNDLVNLLEKYHSCIVDFDEYVNQKEGYFIWQELIEKNAVIYNRYLRPKLSYIKHVLFRM